MNEMMKEEVVVFKDGEFSLVVNIDTKHETVLLSANQMALLFDRDEKTIRKHINNVFKDQEVNKESNTQKMRVPNSDKPVPFYSLDVIISVGYRVKSQRGIQFRQWATKVLKDYMIKGVAVNEKRIQYLEKTVEITSSMIAGALNIDTQDVLYVVKQYTGALELLDNYDHQCVERPKGSTEYVPITEEDCWTIINKMSFKGVFPLFGQEKEPGKLRGIL